MTVDVTVTSQQDRDAFSGITLELIFRTQSMTLKRKKKAPLYDLDEVSNQMVSREIKRV